MIPASPSSTSLENFGQLGAAARVFERLEGEFAWAWSMPTTFSKLYVLHIQVHLAVPQPISLTSSNVVEVDAEDEVMIGGRVGFGGNHTDSESFA